MFLYLLFSALCATVFSQNILVIVNLKILIMFLIFKKYLNKSFSQKKPSTANAEMRPEEVSYKGVGTQGDEESTLTSSITDSSTMSISSFQVPDIILPTCYTPRSVLPPLNSSPGLSPEFLVYCKKKLLSRHVHPQRLGTSRSQPRFMYEWNRCNDAMGQTLKRSMSTKSIRRAITPLSQKGNKLGLSCANLSTAYARYKSAWI